MRTLLLLLALLLVGCGREQGPASPAPTEPPASSDAATPAALVRIDLDVEEGAADRETLDAVLAVLRRRLDLAGHAAATLAPVSDTSLEVGLHEVENVDRVIDLLVAPGDVRLRVEVLPSATYRADRREHVPPRLERGQDPWPGTAAEFDAFKHLEVDAWLDAEEEDTPYQPSNPRYFVAPRAGSDRSSVEDFAVLEEPGDANERFDDRIFADARASRDPTLARPVVLATIAEPYREAFGAWTEANLGLPVAILVEGEYRIAPVLLARLSDRLMISLGPEPEDEAQARTEDLAIVLASGRLPVPLRLDSLELR